MITKNQASYLKGLIATYADALAQHYYEQDQGYDRAYKEKVKAEMEQAKARLDKYITKLMEPKK